MHDTLFEGRHAQQSMSPRRIATWQKVVALAPLLLLPVSLPSTSLLRCRIDGLVRSACCCPPEADPGNSVPVVKAQDCCDREVSVNDPPVVESARRFLVDTTWALSAAVPVSVFSFALAEPNRSDRAWHAHTPPREGPSIVLLKQSFLI